jgi:hypothetical protein
MKVLVATRATQGTRGNDYHWAIEGELVRVGEVCRKDRNDPDGGCGCGRGFAGLNSHRATTTARVAEVPLDHALRGRPGTTALLPTMPIAPLTKPTPVRRGELYSCVRDSDR